MPSPGSTSGGTSLVHCNTAPPAGDNLVIGAGKRGPVTEQIQKKFFGIIKGELEDKYGWLSFI